MTFVSWISFTIFRYFGFGFFWDSELLIDCTKEFFIAISIRVTGKDYSDTVEMMTPGSPKRTGWKLLKVVTILNTNRVYSNPAAEQC